MFARPPGESIESLAVERIGSEPVVVVADAKLPLGGVSGIKIESLKDESRILMNRPRSMARKHAKYEADR